LLSKRLACGHEQPPCLTHDRQPGESSFVRSPPQGSRRHGAAFTAVAGAFFPSFARCQCNQSPGLDIPFAESQVPSFAAPPPTTKYCHPKELSFRILAISTARQSKTRACAGSALGPVGSVDSKWAAISRVGFGLRRLHFTRSCTSFRVHFLLPGTTRPPCIRVVSCYLRWSCQ